MVVRGRRGALVARPGAGAAAGSADELNEVWERHKASEKGRTSAVDGVPMNQPALALAAKLVSRAKRAGIEAAQQGVDEIGDRLLSVVADAVQAGIDPETALRRTARAYRDAIVKYEANQAE